MPINVGELLVSVDGDTSDLDQGLAAVIAQLKGLTTEGGKVGSSMNDVAKEMTGAAEASEEAAEKTDTYSVSLASLQEKAQAAAAAVDEVGTSAQATGAAMPAVQAQGTMALDGVATSATKASAAVEKTSTSMQRMGARSVTAQQGLSGVAQAMTGLSGGAATATGRIGSLATTMLGSFAVGGPIALGIGAAVGGLSMLTSHLRESAQNARQLDALHEVLGISGEEVDRLRTRFSALGQEVDQRVAVQIMRAGREAGYSAGEITRMAGELKKLSDLSGGDIQGATAQLFKADNASAKDLVTTLQRLAQERKDQAEGVRKDEREVLDATRERQQELEKLRERHEELKRAVKEASEEYYILNQNQRRLFSEDQLAMSPQEITARAQSLKASIREMREEVAGGAETSARLSQELDGIAEAGGEAETALEKLLRVEEERRQKEKAATDAARRLEEEKRLTEQRLEASERLETQTRILQAQAAADRKAELRELAEEEIRIQQQSVDRRMLSAEAFASWRTAREAQLAADLAAIDEEAARETARRETTVRLMRAQAMGDQAAAARITAEREMEEEQAKVDGITYTWEEYYRWRAARAAQLDSELRAISEREAERNARNAERARAEVDRALQDKERAAVAGIQAGGSFIAGMKQAFESGEPEDAFRSLLQLASSIMGMVPGGQIPGAVMGAFSGLFHDGGMVGSEGRPVPRYHSGGMIVAHQGMMLPEPGPGEVPILAQSGEGVLSRKGVAAAGGPEAVRAWNAGEQPRGSSGGVAVNINAPGGFLHQELINRAVVEAMRRAAIMQEDPVMRSLGPTMGPIARRG